MSRMLWPLASAMLPLGQRRQGMVLPTSVWSPRPLLGEYWPLGHCSHVFTPTPEYVPGALQEMAYRAAVSYRPRMNLAGSNLPRSAAPVQHAVASCSPVTAGELVVTTGALGASLAGDAAVGGLVKVLAVTCKARGVGAQVIRLGKENTLLTCSLPSGPPAAAGTAQNAHRTQSQRRGWYSRPSPHRRFDGGHRWCRWRTPWRWRPWHPGRGCTGRHRKPSWPSRLHSSSLVGCRRKGTAGR